jgi:hypothetical protein
MRNLAQILLEKGADPNIQTSKSTNLLTPIHKLILNNNENLLSLFINHKSISFKKLMYDK